MTTQPAPRVTDPHELAEIARELRKDVIRMITPLGQGYLQQGLGAADLLATLYFAELRLDPRNPDWSDRDRFILSAAHNTAILHATLAARGFLPASSLSQYCRDGSPLEINASERLGPVIEATCGSLGQGLSVGVGMALHAKRLAKDYRTYVLLGDGELQEGQVWEAALYAANCQLSNLCVLIDLNNMQVEGKMEGPLQLGSTVQKWRAFGWRAVSIDGHEHAQILAALEKARKTIAARRVLSLQRLLEKGSAGSKAFTGTI